MAKLILLYICARISIAERRQINEKKSLPEINRVDGPTMSTDLTNGRSRLSSDNMAKSFSAFSNNNDALVIRGPGKIFNGTDKWLQQQQQQVNVNGCYWQS